MKKNSKLALYEQIMHKVSMAVKKTLNEGRRSLEIVTYDELSDEAKKVAYEAIKDKAYEAYSDWDWEDASETLDKFREVTGCDFELQASSQGPYTQRVKTPEFWDYTDEEIEEYNNEILNKIKDDKFVGTWSDGILQDIVNKYDSIDDLSRFIRNVACSFYTAIYHNCISYYDNEEITVEYIEANDIEFFEDGTPYKLK